MTSETVNNAADVEPSAPPLQDMPQEPPAAAAPAGVSAADAERISRLTEVLNKHEITIADADDLGSLEGYEVVVIADDSGSMSLHTADRRSRWAELGETVTTILEVATCVVDSADVFFLNRAAVFDVRSGDDARLREAFNTGPSGSTPLLETLRGVVERKMDCERPVLCLVATDGEPNGGPANFARYVRKVIAKQETRTTFKFQFLACTDDDDSVAWLDKLDKEFKEVDCTDDYRSEKQQILATGKVQHFRRSDWVMKALLGPICAKFDGMDEAKSKSTDSPSWMVYAFILAILAWLLGLID
eukprot:Rhum_TRINITY_DN3157_c0_g1::Rhum_TRINITY_DN3157_c0_g1_i1::g.9811::m.9811